MRCREGVIRENLADSKINDHALKSGGFVGAAVLAVLMLAGSAGTRAAQPRAASEIYIRDENSRLSVDFVERMIRDAETVFTSTPHGIEKFAAFMHRIGSIREPPLSWKDLFFAEIHAAPGN